MTGSSGEANEEPTHKHSPSSTVFAVGICGRTWPAGGLSMTDLTRLFGSLADVVVATIAILPSVRRQALAQCLSLRTSSGDPLPKYPGSAGNLAVLYQLERMPGLRQLQGIDPVRSTDTTIVGVGEQPW